MQVAEVKFIRVDIKKTDDNDAYESRHSKALDKAYNEMSIQITKLLKNGWSMKGEPNYIDTSYNGQTVTEYLVQTMVKYEEKLMDIRGKVDAFSLLI